ncbi:putative secreted protein [Corynebacterium kutscheri]|uniref:Secreted protein n=2 Tax=Corynebacterium kutscheri TaxID=35755 RepID=A0A0F6TD74_9CORY|nr:hypothetical protein [Corynebacterium kutscheri]AKE40624.1 hypothetical protein UL82_01995 [Corynebacterium kutscheri]VEH04829.1 putative secreted protein [Corynebacterium kutscheri]VEH11021.1 putative secreted protein [Corynebacterium kutscheri]VEH80500.1 putative secreted protein [Corynebacterium kutscheri]
MELGAKSKPIVFGAIALFLVVIVAVVAASANNTALAEQQGKLEQKLSGIDANGLNITAVALADVYGLEYTAAAPVCPGETEQGISSRLGIDASEMHLPSTGVPAGYNYLLVANQDGSILFDRFAIDDINVCKSAQTGVIDAYQLTPFVKDPATGTWFLNS